MLFKLPFDKCSFDFKEITQHLVDTDWEALNSRLKSLDFSNRLCKEKSERFFSKGKGEKRS